MRSRPRVGADPGSDLGSDPLYIDDDFLSIYKIIIQVLALSLFREDHLSISPHKKDPTTHAIPHADVQENSY